LSMLPGIWAALIFSGHGLQERQRGERFEWERKYR
jgi:hypothetical protein